MIVRIDCVVYVEVEDDADLEDVAAEFNSGLRVAVDPFPRGDVVTADVTGISKPEQAELEEKGLVE